MSEQVFEWENVTGISRKTPLLEGNALRKHTLSAKGDCQR